MFRNIQDTGVIALSEELRGTEAENELVEAEFSGKSVEAPVEKNESFLAREMALLRLILARFGLTLMHFAGLIIIGLAVYEAFFNIGEREDTMDAIQQVLLVAPGGFLLAITTWLWSKIVK